jgi:putative FmdB family regulatory protein
MPHYQYLCESCGEEQEHFFTMSEVDKKKVKCSKCKKIMIRLITGGAGFVLKGEGWPGKTIKQEGENDKTITKARIARRMKNSGAVPMEEHLTAKDVDPAKYHGDLSMNELKNKSCDYQGLKGKAKKDKSKEK